MYVCMYKAYMNCQKMLLPMEQHWRRCINIIICMYVYRYVYMFTRLDIYYINVSTCMYICI